MTGFGNCLLIRNFSPSCVIKSNLNCLKNIYTSNVCTLRILFRGDKRAQTYKRCSYEFIAVDRCEKYSILIYSNAVELINLKYLLR